MERTSDGFTTVRIHEPLADAIDDHVEKAKDQLGLKKYKSRADFVEEAVKTLLKLDNGKTSSMKSSSKKEVN